ncbi:hypothetical protein FDV58_16335 [Bradyrhizobium elkanii]|uniref:Uncharacterized protein n=1 Tax=Bradyrhizobium elkanii TaxID=29448 RepID=A0A4U6RYM6_BRAEL|nr:hypothetical protein [Bradyrhizobium sp. BR2003]TKV80344.1 hypothetical protein FDV58_16335 [Bradyrhizobium elkanii]
MIQSHERLSIEAGNPSLAHAPASEASRSEPNKKQPRARNLTENGQIAVGRFPEWPLSLVACHPPIEIPAPFSEVHDNAQKKYPSRNGTGRRPADATIETVGESSSETFAPLIREEFRTLTEILKKIIRC